MLVFELLNSGIESLEEAIHKKRGHSQKNLDDRQL